MSYSGQQLYAAFYEVLNNVALNDGYTWALPVFPDSFNVTHGDSMFMSVAFDQSTTTASLYVADNTVHNGSTHYFSVNWDVALGELQTGETLYDGSTADWIDEDSGGYPPNPMADYGTNNWSEMKAQLDSDGSWQDFGATDPENDYVFDGTQYLSTTSSWTTPAKDATTYTDDWFNCT